jgi:hypothetical protein
VVTNPNPKPELCRPGHSAGGELTVEYDVEDSETDEEEEDDVVGRALTFEFLSSEYAMTTVRDAAMTTTAIATASIFRNSPPVVGVKRAEPREVVFLPT